MFGDQLNSPPAGRTQIGATRRMQNGSRKATRNFVFALRSMMLLVGVSLALGRAARSNGERSHAAGLSIAVIRHSSSPWLGAILVQHLIVR